MPLWMTMVDSDSEGPEKGHGTCEAGLAAPGGVRPVLVPEIKWKLYALGDAEDRSETPTLNQHVYEDRCPRRAMVETGNQHASPRSEANWPSRRSFRPTG